MSKVENNVDSGGRARRADKQSTIYAISKSSFIVIQELVSFLYLNEPACNFNWHISLIKLRVGFFDLSMAACKTCAWVISKVRYGVGLTREKERHMCISSINLPKLFGHTDQTGPPAETSDRVRYLCSKYILIEVQDLTIGHFEPAREKNEKETRQA
jgi:hypothetical protein